MLLLYYKASFTRPKLLIYIDKLVLQHVFTRQGSQVRTLYHPPVISQLNRVLTRNRSAFFTSKSSGNTPYYDSYIFRACFVRFCSSGFAHLNTMNAKAHTAKRCALDRFPCAHRYWGLAGQFFHNDELVGRGQTDFCYK